MPYRFLHLAFALLILITALPVVLADSPSAAANRLKQATGGHVSIRYSSGTGAASFVRATDDAVIPVSGTFANLTDKAF